MVLPWHCLIFTLEPGKLFVMECVELRPFFIVRVNMLCRRTWCPWIWNPRNARGCVCRKSFVDMTRKTLVINGLVPLMKRKFTKKTVPTNACHGVGTNGGLEAYRWTSVERSWDKHDAEAPIMMSKDPNNFLD